MSIQDMPVDYRRSPSPGTVFPIPSRNMLRKKDLCQIDDSPVRKNKRKSSEPKKRTDFSIKRFCPDSPSPGSACSESGRSEDTDNNNEDSPNSPARCPSGMILPEREEPRGGHQSDSNSSPPVPHGLVLYPTHIPPGYLIPGFPYGHPGLPFPPQHSHLNVPRLDYLNRNNTSNYVPSSEKVEVRSHVDKASEKNMTYSENENITIGSNTVEEDTEDGYISDSMCKNGSKKSRKNYKNMTRERRIEANARERTRVHTISAAFENLRRAVPSYSYNQKLSKLAILRIASSYIMALGRLTEIDNFDNKESRTEFGECVDLCTRTIQTEGRARRRH
ncbi:transcription factor ATOH8-like [Ostrea edulis]|uniref:transcription factor ATOH8-like n=1 Tax=Ostrea edulis TaxID=37623 RepID=UPI0020941FC8|nr:transcription factor ATOH8-like [Ostrea edulis]